MNYRNGEEVLPGWRLTYEEFANSAFKITLRHIYGSEISRTCIDSELEKTFDQMKEDASVMSKRINQVLERGGK